MAYSAWGIDHGAELIAKAETKKKRPSRHYERESPAWRPGVFNDRRENVRTRAAWGAGGGALTGALVGGSMALTRGRARGIPTYSLRAIGGRAAGVGAGGAAGGVAGGAGGAVFGGVQRDKRHKYASADRKFHNAAYPHRRQRDKGYSEAYKWGQITGIPEVEHFGQRYSDVRYTQNTAAYRKQNARDRAAVRARAKKQKNR